MRRFALEGRAIFYAEDIDDAFEKLAKHFANPPDSDLFMGGTDIHIHPIDPEDKETNETRPR